MLKGVKKNFDENYNQRFKKKRFKLKAKINVPVTEAFENYYA